MDSDPSHKRVIYSVISKSLIISLITICAFSTPMWSIMSHKAVAATKEKVGKQMSQILPTQVGMSTVMSASTSLQSNLETASSTSLEAGDEIVAPDPAVEEEILWFARAIYSETKIPSEQKLVAWVIRNRVEAPQYPHTYEKVVLQSRQFSGLNEGDAHYYTNISIKPGDMLPGWETALSLAREVYFADPKNRPISGTVWHFYSPNAVRRIPGWAQGVEPVHVVQDTATQTVRFAFFADVR